MMPKTAAIFALLLLFGFDVDRSTIFSQAHASNIVTRRDGEWSASFGSLDEKQQQQEDVRCAKSDGAYWIEVKQRDALVKRLTFCTTMTPNVRPIVDRNGRIFLLVEKGEGQGPRAYTLVLSVMLWNTQWFEEVAKVPLELPQGFIVDWQYSYTAQKLPEGGIEVTLTGVAASGREPLSAEELKSPEIQQDTPFLLPGITLRFATTKPKAAK